MDFFKPLKGLLGAAVLLVAGALVLCACSGTPRGLEHRDNLAVSPAEEEPSSLEDQSFALQVWSMSTEHSERFVSTTFGEGLMVRAGAFYTSALGEECRKAQFYRHNSPVPVAFAVCRRDSSEESEPYQYQYRVLPPLNGQ